MDQSQPKAISSAEGKPSHSAGSATGKQFTFDETLEHIKPHAEAIYACGICLLAGGVFVKMISDIKEDVSDIRRDVGKLREVSDVKISKLQATTDVKSSKLQAVLKATNTPT